MKRTVIPTKGEKIFHLYLWGGMLTLAFVALLDLFFLLLMALALHLTSFGEEQVTGCMPILVFGCWIVSGFIGYKMHKKHLEKCSYDFSKRKIQLASIVTQVQTAIIYFVIIALF